MGGEGRGAWETRERGWKKEGEGVDAFFSFLFFFSLTRPAALRPNFSLRSENFEDCVARRSAGAGQVPWEAESVRERERPFRRRGGRVLSLLTRPPPHTHRPFGKVRPALTYKVMNNTVSSLRGKGKERERAGGGWVGGRLQNKRRAAAR